MTFRARLKAHSSTRTGMAARRAAPEDVERLKSLVEQQRKNDGDLLLTLQTDLQLYQAMVEGAGSLVARLMFATLSRLSQACLEKVPALLFVHPDYLEHIEVMVEAIAKRKPEEASASLDGLYQKTDTILLQRIGRLP